MNGILGYLRLDQSPVEPEAWAVMQQAMASWGVDGASTWQQGPIALGCQYCHCLPEAKQAGNLPIQPSSEGWVIVAGARLDNREELLVELDIPPEQWSSLPDAMLIRPAYSRWGEDCVDHLLGDWHFALWDLKNQKLLLARDHHGNIGLCYVHGPGFFAFASNQKPLLALPEVPKKPDLFHLAQILTSWHGDGVRTAYEGILRLPPAHCLTVSNGNVQVRRYWYLENAPIVRLTHEEDYLEGFLEHYSRAVRSRLRSYTPLATTLSGGLDSGSVSVLAARELHARGEHLTAFTSVPLTNPDAYTPKHRFGDETPFAQATADQAGNIDLTWIRAEEVSVLKGIEEMLAVHDCPGHAAANQYWIHALLDTTRQQGMRVLLTGQGGNATVSWTGGMTNLLPFRMPGEWGTFIQTFSQLRQRHQISPLHAIKRFILKPLLYPLWRYRYRSWKFWQPAYLKYSAIHPQFAQAMNLDHLMVREGHDPHFLAQSNPQTQRYKIIKPGQMLGCALWGESSGAYGLEVRDPTLDKRFMEFCLGIPDEFHYADGYDRAILRCGLKGILPDKVRLNRRRGLQAADIICRLQTDLAEIEQKIHQMEQNPMITEMLDLPRMRGVLTACREYPTRENTRDCGCILIRGLGVGLFLLRF